VPHLRFELRQQARYLTVVLTVDLTSQVRTRLTVSSDP